MLRVTELLDDSFVREPWPSHIYFEDIAAESQFEMIEIIVETVRDEGAFGG